MPTISQAWNNFKSQPEIWFFYGFLATWPLSVRKILTSFPVAGMFNEYSIVAIYLSDLFLIATILVWLLLIFKHKLSNLSIDTVITVPRGTLPILILILAFNLWILISVFWSTNVIIAIYRFLKVFEFSAFFFFIASNPKCSTPKGMFHPERNVPPRKECSTWNILRGRRRTFYEADIKGSIGQAWNILKNISKIIIILGLINALIGISQVIFQHSLGLFWLKESLISPDLPGIAKIVFGGKHYIRAYGLFPHPNILGGFLMMSVLLTLGYFKIFQPGRNVSRLPRETEMFHPGMDVPRETSYGASVKHFSFLLGGTWLNLFLAFQVIGILLTFSKSAILGLIIAVLYLFRYQLFATLKTKWNLKALKWLISGLFLAILLIFTLKPDFSAIFRQSLEERAVYQKAAHQIISDRPLFGLGAGQFVLLIQEYSPQILESWQLQPVHNVLILIQSELGLIGSFLFMLFLWKLFHLGRNVPRVPHETVLFHVEQNSFLRGGTNRGNLPIQTLFKAILIGFFVISLFDHYLWDIQQGQIMLWMALGFLASFLKLNSIFPKNAESRST